MRPGLVDGVARPAQHRADRRAEPLREAEHHRVGAARTRSAGDTPSRDRGVPDPRAVDVHREAVPRADVGRPRRARRRATADPTPACTCSRCSPRRSAAGGTARRRRHASITVGGAARRRRRRAGAAGCRSSPARHPTRSGTRARASPHSTSVPCGAVQPERELVRHRARRHEQRGLHAEQRGGQRLQPVDGGVLAVRVVADLGVGHGPPHLGRRRGDGVGPEVDDRRSRRGHVRLRPAGSGPPGSPSPRARRRAGTRSPRRARARPTPTGSAGGTAATRRRGTGGGTTSRGRGSRSSRRRRTRHRVRQRRGVDAAHVGRVRDRRTRAAAGRRASAPSRAEPQCPARARAPSPRRTTGGSSTWRISIGVVRSSHSSAPAEKRSRWRRSARAIER